MKLALLAASVAAGLLCAVPADAAPTAKLTIDRLGIYGKPIGNGDAALAYGPIWEPSIRARPGQGKVMVIAGHDVTPVPGYGSHGPFYHLVTVKKGDLVQVRWRGELHRYRVRGPPQWQPESNRYVVMDHGYEAVWFYTCWPRYTHNGRLWIEAVKVPP